MLLTSRGHVKLTDFGLSKVGAADRELRIRDLVQATPGGASSATARVHRTPGQILSLTAHLRFDKDSEESRGGSEEAAGYEEAGGGSISSYLGSLTLRKQQDASVATVATSQSDASRYSPELSKVAQVREVASFARKLETSSQIDILVHISNESSLSLVFRTPHLCLFGALVWTACAALPPPSCTRRPRTTPPTLSPPSATRQPLLRQRWDPRPRPPVPGDWPGG